MVYVKAPLQIPQAKALVHDFFKEFEKVCNGSNTSTHALEKFLEPTFELCLNGKQVCKNLTNYTHFIEKLKSQYSNLCILGENDAPIVADHQIIVQYNVELTPHQGPKRNLRMMAIATLDGNKIAKWQQLSHEKK